VKLIKKRINKVVINAKTPTSVEVSVPGTGIADWYVGTIVNKKWDNNYCLLKLKYSFASEFLIAHL